jgi:hypothetical protein
VEEAQRVEDLEVHQDLPFEERNWRIQRLGWSAMGLFVLAGLTGVFGRGPLSSAAVTSPGALLRVEYERLARHGAPSEFRLTVAPAAVGDRTVRLVVSRSFLQGQHVEGVQPPPDSTLVSGDTVMFTFRATPGRPVQILFRLTPDEYFMRRAQVGLAGTPERVEFGQFVFP